MSVLDLAAKLPLGLEGVLKRFFEDAPADVAILKRGSTLQGVEITAIIGKSARENLVSLGSGRAFMPDGYQVCLHPHDYARLDPLLEEIKTDAITHLEKLRQKMGGHIKVPFSVSFIRDEKLPEEGMPRVNATFKHAEERTTLTMPGSQRERGVTFQAEGFDVAGHEWLPLWQVVRLLHERKADEALKALQEADLDRADHALGSILQALCYFLGGDFRAGLFLLNRTPILRDSEHGHHLRSLAYLSCGDTDRASEFLQRATEKAINPMGFLVKGLIAVNTGNQGDGTSCFRMAMADSDLKQAMNRHLGDLLDEDSNKATALRSISLRDMNYNEVFHILLTMPVGLKSKGTQLDDEAALEAVPAGQGDFDIMPRGNGLVVLGNIQVNGQEPDFCGAVLKHVDRKQLETLGWTVEQTDKPAQWSEDSARDYTRSCYTMRLPSRKETWLLPLDNTLTIGREANVGNDLVLANNPRLSGSGHCELHWDHEHITIRDLASTNGTGKNGGRITALAQVPIINGDEIQLGDRRFLVSINTRMV